MPWYPVKGSLHEKIKSDEIVKFPDLADFFIFSKLISWVF